MTTAERDEAEVAKLTAQRKREIGNRSRGSQSVKRQPSNLALKPRHVNSRSVPTLVPATCAKPGNKLICEAIANGLRESQALKFARKGFNMAAINTW